MTKKSPIPLELSENQFGLFKGDHKRPLMAMVEITNRCNMSCPICFSTAEKSGGDIPREQVFEYLQQLKDVAGPIPLQISGGEPTLHPHLADIIAHARFLGFKNIELITNGIKISSQPEFLNDLVKNGLTAVYLQFDALSKSSLLHIRGRDMRDVRRKSIEVIRSAGICCTLAVAVTRGVNDHELGDIVNFAIENIDTVRAINFQAATQFTGRYPQGQEDEGYTLSELLRKLEEQTGVADEGFLRGVLGHSQCNAISLVYVMKNKLEPLFKYIPKQTIIELLGENPQEMIHDLFQGKAKFIARNLGKPKVWKALLKAVPIFGKLPTPASIAKAEHLLLFAKSFMERDAMSGERIDRCCYAISGERGVISFCAYNNIYRNLSHSQQEAQK